MEECKSEIGYDDFLKLDLRVGSVTEAARVPKSKKLLNLKVNFEDFERQIVAGIGALNDLGVGITPESLIGMQFVFVVNLAPRAIMGVESHGMILAAKAEESIALFIPNRIDVKNGESLG